jgi:divalent metal cation (Fe/Co/Zn/Cd) transporter
MGPDDFIQPLQAVRAEVQALYAMQCIPRIELDQCVQSIFRLIDHQVDMAMRANISNLVQTAKEMHLEVQALNRQRGRYFGSVFCVNFSEY